MDSLQPAAHLTVTHLEHIDGESESLREALTGSISYPQCICTHNVLHGCVTETQKGIEERVCVFKQGGLQLGTATVCVFPPKAMTYICKLKTTT